MRSCWHFWREIQPTDVSARPNVLKSSYRKIWSNILTARWRASAWSDKMNKGSICWWSLRGSDSCKKICLIAPFSELPWCCGESHIEHKVIWKHSEQLRRRWTSDNMRIIPWWLTDHHNCASFKLFSLWQSQHAVCHCQETGKTTQLNYCNALVIRVQYTVVCSEGRTRDVSFLPSLLIDVYALFSDVSLRLTGFNDPGWEIPGPFCSRAMLICSIIWLGKRVFAGCCSAGSVLRWRQKFAPYSVSLICIVKLFLR